MAQVPRITLRVFFLDVVLDVGGATQIDVALQVGAVSEAVTITVAPPLLDATSPSLSRVVDERTIESLPNLGRNFVDFAELSTGVAPGRENVGGGAFKEPDTGVGEAAAPRLSFGGQSELETSILVDGAQNVQTFTGLPRVTPSQEAAQEFRILNSTYSSEYGRASGGFVNIVTKSGTSDYHGSAYFLGMNQALNKPYALARDIRFNERVGGELTFDLFNVTNRVNVSDLNTVCECDLPASDFSPSNLKSTIGSLNPLFGFDTPRQTLNPLQFQYGFKVRF